jgi:DinB family protein
MPALMTRPEADEYIPYFGRYISLIPEGDVLELLRTQNQVTCSTLVNLTEAQALHRYAPGKWSVKETIGHLADGERVFSYRALRFARADETPVPGFEENEWVPAARFDRRPLSALLAEYRAVRDATIALFSTFDETEWSRRGNANGNMISVRALACCILGHELHHLSILRDRYGVTP